MESEHAKCPITKVHPTGYANIATPNATAAAELLNCEQTSLTFLEKIVKQFVGFYF